MLAKAEAPFYIGRGRGEVAEWSNAAVLKTVDVQASLGSNPSLSATMLQLFQASLFVGQYQN